MAPVIHELLNFEFIRSSVWFSYFREHFKIKWQCFYCCWAVRRWSNAPILLYLYIIEMLFNGAFPFPAVRKQPSKSKHVLKREYAILMRNLWKIQYTWKNWYSDEQNNNFIQIGPNRLLKSNLLDSPERSVANHSASNPPLIMNVLNWCWGCKNLPRLVRTLPVQSSILEKTEYNAGILVGK